MSARRGFAHLEPLHEGLQLPEVVEAVGRHDAMLVQQLVHHEVWKRWLQQKTMN